MHELLLIYSLLFVLGLLGLGFLVERLPKSIISFIAVFGPLLQNLSIYARIQTAKNVHSGLGAAYSNLGHWMALGTNFQFLDWSTLQFCNGIQIVDLWYPVMLMPLFLKLCLSESLNIQLLRCLSPGTISDWPNRADGVFLFLLSMLYSFLCQTITKVLSPSTTAEFKCDPAQRKLIHITAVGFALLYMIGIPAYFVLKLSMHQHKLFFSKPKPKKGRHGFTSLETSDLDSRYGWMYRLYKPERWWWFSVLMFRRCTIVVIFGAWQQERAPSIRCGEANDGLFNEPSDTLKQCYLLITVEVIWMWLLFMARPYSEDLHMRCDGVLSTLCLVFLFSVLHCLHPDEIGAQMVAVAVTTGVIAGSTREDENRTECIRIGTACAVILGGVSFCSGRNVAVLIAMGSVVAAFGYFLVAEARQHLKSAAAAAAAGAVGGGGGGGGSTLQHLGDVLQLESNLLDVDDICEDADGSKHSHGTHDQARNQNRLHLLVLYLWAALVLGKHQQ
jgi:hypothetical protein